MELKINIDESRFKDVLENELQAFSKEELHEIIRKGLIECLSNKEQMKELFVKEKNGWHNGEYEANDLLKEAARTINFDKAFDSLQKEVVDYVMNNHSEIVRDLVYNTFLEGLSSTFFYNSNFRNNLQANIAQYISQIQQNNGY